MTELKTSGKLKTPVLSGPVRPIGSFSPLNAGAFLFWRVGFPNLSTYMNTLTISQRETETQSNRVTERLSYRGNRDTETLRLRETDETHETECTDERVPKRIVSVNEAICYSLRNQYTEQSLFDFCRALKAIDNLDLSALEPLFQAWWQRAKPYLPADCDYGQTLSVFEVTFATTKVPLGADCLNKAIEQSMTARLPDEAIRYAYSAAMQRLLSVCWQLQLMAGCNAFYLGVRSAAEILGHENIKTASCVLRKFVADGVLTVTNAGKQGGRKATRYIFTKILKEKTR